MSPTVSGVLNKNDEENISINSKSYIKNLVKRNIILKECRRDEDWFLVCDEVKSRDISRAEVKPVKLWNV
ncbi:hypothetical protein C0J52_04367 [Blattella germanica]|nr:hypothetical protein C0J52_04367 [Blattella germanica]